MIIHFNPVGHTCQANVIHRLLDNQMSCIENFVDEVLLLQHFIWDFINGFFMYNVSVEVAGLDDFFICIVCSPHHNMKNTLLLFVGSQVSYLKSKCEPLMVLVIRLAFAIFLLFIDKRTIFIISVSLMGNMGLIFLLLIDNLISEHFFGHK